MAKKKNRSVNVARKREKRNRNRKSKSKKIAAEKHHRLPLDRMDEERLRSYLFKSFDLLEEPEIQKVHFDLDLLDTVLSDILKSSIDSDVEVEAELEFSESYQVPNHEQDEENDVVLSIEENSELFEETYELIETEVISRLITPSFKKQLLSSLSSCENRLRKNGNHDRAEVVFVTRSLFEMVPVDVMAGHPIMQCICQQSIQLLFEERLNSEDLPELQKIEYNELQQNESLPSLFSNAISSMLNDIDENQQELTVNIPPIIQKQERELYPETLPAKALYKNFDGLDIRDTLIDFNAHSLNKETDTQLDFINKDCDLYITVTENRLQLHAENEEKLNIAMDNLETHCQSTLMFLAKTFDEGGETDATQ